MRTLSKLLISAALAVSAVPALASGPTEPVVTIIPAPVEPATDWSGFYGGIYLGSAYNPGGQPMAGLKGGYNWQMGSFVLGAEADYFATTNAPAQNEAFINLRGGFVLGEDFLVFATLGRGRWSGGANLNSVGFGGEFMVTDSISIRADYERHNVVGVSPWTGPSFVKIGGYWHF